MTADAADSGHSVLVVDDEAAFAESVAIWLRERWDVEVATSGEEALNAYGPHVDVVLLDRRMPTLSGDEVLAEIRDRPGESGVAMMSAVQPDWDVAEMEFDRYVKKPVTREEVVEAVETLVTRAAYSRELRALFALSEKIAALRAAFPERELESDERFQRLRGEFERVREQVDDRLGGLDDEEVEELMEVVD